MQPAARSCDSAWLETSIATTCAPASRMRASSSCNSCDSGVVWVALILPPGQRDSTVPMSPVRKPRAAESCSTRCAVVVLPFVPVTAKSEKARDGSPWKREAASENVRRGLRATATGTESGKTVEASTATAPFSTAAVANCAPSAAVPGSAAKSAPGVTRRESTASERTSTSAFGGTSASRPDMSSVNFTRSPLLPLTWRRQRDLYACTTLDNRPCARRLRHRPAAAAQIRVERGLRQSAGRRPRRHSGDVGHNRSSSERCNAGLRNCFRNGNQQGRSEQPRFFVIRRRLARLLWHHAELDRKSTRLNSSHLGISYAVFCLKK